MGIPQGLSLNTPTEFEGDSEKRPTKTGATVRGSAAELLTALYKAEAEVRAAGLLK
ncbi:MAG: hypothetical protein H0T87_07330 [Gammaproteobacteria bacterium]|nr:hypothetical protein [Gammaproteobacteria bacterium]